MPDSNETPVAEKPRRITVQRTIQAHNGMYLIWDSSPEDYRLLPESQWKGNRRQMAMPEPDYQALDQPVSLLDSDALQAALTIVINDVQRKLWHRGIVRDDQITDNVIKMLAHHIAQQLPARYKTTSST